MLHRPTTAQFRDRASRIKRTIASLLTPEQMNLAIQRESLRADRKPGSSLVLVLFGFTGAPGAPSTMRLIKTILHRVRISDDVGWFDEQNIGLLLPDTPAAGAWRLAQHICDRIARRGRRPEVVMYSYPATATSQGAMPSVIRQTDLPKVPTAKAS